MDKHNNDYSPLLFLIALMLFALSVDQCQTTMALQDMTHELRMLQYK